MLNSCPKRFSNSNIFNVYQSNFQTIGIVITITIDIIILQINSTAQNLRDVDVDTYTRTRSTKRVNRVRTSSKSFSLPETCYP